jgi:hypothetical protein
MSDDLERPRFLPAYVEAIAQSAKVRGWRAVVPFWLIACGAASAAVAYVIPYTFWTDERLEVSVVVYIGILTLNGLILTLSWNAFSRIYEMIGAPGFASYLMSKKFMTRYIVYVGYVHIAQLVAIITSAIGLLMLLCSIKEVIYNRIGFAVMVATSAYAIVTAARAVEVVHDLIWNKAIFDDFMARQEGRNIVPFGRNDAG